jgi:ATP-dependent DNA ligase
LTQLLSAASGIEAKYILRAVLGTHRIDVADMTFLRALVKAFTGSAETGAAPKPPTTSVRT